MTWAEATLALALLAPVQEAPAPEPEEREEQDEELTPEDIDAQFQWRTGEIALGDGLATIALPDGYRYLDPRQAQVVLEGLWGNPPSELTLGMIFPADTPIADERSWAVVLEFEECGYVSDEDAAEIDYDELLADMQEATEDENEERSSHGYDTLEIIGWAARPQFDQGRHQLLWAKELQFAGAPVRTLNYDVRVLARRGVLSMNAVANMDQLAEIEPAMTALLAAVTLGEGHGYGDFDSSIDEMAAVGIGGLIAGKLALKAGLFKGLLALLIAGKKLVIAAAVAVGAFFFKKKRNRAEAAAS